MYKRIRLYSLTTLAWLIAIPAYAVDAPQVSVSGDTLTWRAIDAISINVHGEQGNWLESIPGDATQWQAPFAGGFFLVGADHGDWMDWGKSNVVYVDENALAEDIPVEPTSHLIIDNYYAKVYSQSMAELFWELPNAEVVEVEVFRDDGVSVKTDGRSFFESNLRPGTTYYYSLFPYDARGNVGEEVYIQLTTDSGSGRGSAVPSSPMRNPNVNNNMPSSDLETPLPVVSLPATLGRSIYNNTRAELHWRGTASNVLINYTVFRNGEEIGQTTGHSFYMDELTPGTDYNFAVTNNGSDGIPADAATVSFTTGGISPNVVKGRPAVDPGTFNFAGWDDIASFSHSSYPSDCRFARRLDGKRNSPVCFSPAQRDLMAARQGRRSASYFDPRWQFKLPGENSTNHIEALSWYSNREFALVADITTSFAQSAYEISRFDLWGSFIGTLPILRSLENSDSDTTRQINLDGADLLVSVEGLTDDQAVQDGDDREVGLRIVGEYYEPVPGQDRSQIDGWKNVGAFIALVHPIRGTTLEQRFLPGRTAQSITATE